jgi:glycolate oxidase iron-sulfur subunit
MQTNLSPEFKNTQAGSDAESILRSCVHCGFCNATCPTYQVLGDELDGPRGRIYLIKQLLEGGEVGRSTQQHLDRCLTCLNCQTTCPSGVEYGRLIGIGRQLVDERVPRPATEKVARWVLREGLTSSLFAPLLKLGRLCRPLLPTLLRKYVPARVPEGAQRLPTRQHARKVLLLAGCVQPGMMPNINGATVRVLDACGIQTLVVPDAGCCGAIREHLSDPEGARVNARRNIDAWWPLVSGGAVEAIISNASACGLTVKSYSDMLGHDAQYRDKAARVATLTRDISELLPELVPQLKGRLGPVGAGRWVFHPPCTLQHGQGLRGGVETYLAMLGFDIRVAGNEAHLCCGSAGTYSVLQPELARQLRDRKLKNLVDSGPSGILSANIGCIQHLQSGTELPVRHWVEVLDAALPAG